MKTPLFIRKSQRLKGQVTDKQSYQNAIRKGSLIATIVAGTPFLFYLYEYVPDVKVWETSFFTYNSNYYESAATAAWVVLMKVVPLLLMLIWFFTCKHWWYHAILVPITMYAFQIFSAISEDYNVDVLGMVYILPTMALVFPSIYIIRSQMINKITEADRTMEELEEEFMIKPKDFMGKIKQYF